MASTLPAGQVRYARSYADFGTRPVELIVPGGRGEEIEGHIRVPLNLVGTKQHSNERLEFEALIASELKRWIEWRSQLGWNLVSEPKVKGPVDPMVDNPASEVPDYKEYWVRAFFRPNRPIYIGLEDAYELEDQAKRFGVDIYEPKPVSSLEGQRTRAVIHDDRPLLNPMHAAEEHRLKYGFKRSELLMGDISEPLEPPK